MENSSVLSKQPKGFGVLGFCLLLLSEAFHLTFTANVLHAEAFLSSEGARVARHDRRKSQVSFYNDKGHVGSMWGYSFEHSLFEELPESHRRAAGHLPLENCSDTGAELKEVRQGSSSRFGADITFYNPHDRSQSTAASRHRGKVIPYKAKVSDRPGNHAEQLVLEFAQFVGARCLPWRVRTIEIGNRLYVEYLRGEQVWGK